MIFASFVEIHVWALWEFSTSPSVALLDRWTMQFVCTLLLLLLKSPFALLHKNITKDVIFLREPWLEHKTHWDPHPWRQPEPLLGYQLVFSKLNDSETWKLSGIERLPRYSFIEVRKLQNTSKHALAHISQEFSVFSSSVSSWFCALLESSLHHSSWSSWKLINLRGQRFGGRVEGACE